MSRRLVAVLSRRTVTCRLLLMIISNGPLLRPDNRLLFACRRTLAGIITHRESLAFGKGSVMLRALRASGDRATLDATLLAAGGPV